MTTGSAPTPLPLRVRLPFESEEAFIRRFGANVSPSGIFIPTRSLKPEGTHLRFELVLADGTRLLRGGVVVQNAIETAPGRRGGMELAFTELDAQSHAVLARILAARPGAEDSQGLGVPSWRRPPTVTGAEASVRAPPAPPPPATESAPLPGQGATAGADPSSPPGPGGDASGTSGGHHDVAGAVGPSPAGADAGARAAGATAPGTGTTRAASTRDAPSPGRQAPRQPIVVASATASSGAGDAGVSPTASPDTLEPPPSAAALPGREPDAPQPEGAQDAAREAAQIAQSRARAARVETLAEASAREADALVSRIRGAAPTTVLAASVDFPEAGVARWKGGGLSVRPSSRATGSAWALRLLGQRADAPRVLELAATEGRPVQSDPGGIARWEEDGQLTGGVEWAARWLERQAHAGEALAADARPMWVLALPLHSGHRQREVWVAAAAHLGFDRVQLTSSPVAAAVAYAHGKGFARRRLLVLSTGVVGFDAAIVQLTGDDVETLSAAGDPFIGLPELEARLAYELRRRLREAALPVPEAEGPAGLALREACSTARHALETVERTTVSLAVAADTGATTSFEVTREDLDGVSHDLIERQVALVTEVLAEAQLSAAGVDGVLVLGSVERSPLWKQLLSELLGRELSAADEVEPSSVVRGAALIGEAGVRTGRGRRPFTVSEVLSIPLAIAERGGRLRRVLERGSQLPLSKTLTLPVDAGQELSVMLYQGAGTVLADAAPLGAALVQAPLPGELELQLRVDGDGRIQGTVEAPGASRVPLSEVPREPEARERLLAKAPEGPDDDARGSGLLGGLRRLFRKA